LKGKNEEKFQNFQNVKNSQVKKQVGGKSHGKKQKGKKQEAQRPRKTCIISSQWMAFYCIILQETPCF
jgi:hypothetical protein